VVREKNKTIIPFFILLIFMLLVFLGTIYLFLSEEEWAVVKGKLLGKEVTLNEEVETDGFLAERQLCQVQEDCIPLPSCHPTECINKRFEYDFKKPDECMLNFNPAAAYEERDCACRKGRCINKNADNR